MRTLEALTIIKVRCVLRKNQVDENSNIYRLTDKSLQLSLLLLALCAPLSIAGTQIAWSLALLFCLIRLAFVRPTFKTDGITIAIIAFVGLTLVSSFFSYEPQVSLKKMVAVSLVTIVHLVAQNIRDTKMVRRAVVILLISGTVAAAYAIGKFAIGTNLKVTKLTADSPLRPAGVQEGDTILRANGQSVASPDQLLAAVNGSPDGKAALRIYRYENILDYEMAATSTQPDSLTRFGIETWSRGRDVRASGFYGHYTTYAETAQLLASVALGLLIMAPGGLFARNKLLLGAVLATFSFALFLTVTRASWAGFMISGAAMVLIGASRKVVIICILCAIPVAAGGLFYLQQKRNIGFVDTGDNSTTWRTTVWREAVGVLASNPRHLALGVGMDSIKTHWQDWQMFDNGKLPIGHMHSNPIAFAFERGLPALIAWVIWMFLYLRMLWRGFRRGEFDWFERGVLLGALGGTVGFLASGLVHYNWGDSEVVMIFFLLMGLSLSVISGGRIPHPSTDGQRA